MSIKHQTFIAISKLVKIFSVIFFIISLSACDHGVLWESENFAVYWIDNPKNIELGRKVSGGYLGMSSPPFSIGVNDQYFVLKTEYGYNYYDQRVEDKSNQSLFLRVGNLTEEEFLNAKEKLTLPDFQITF